MKPPYKTLVRLGSLTLLALPAAMMAATDYQSTVLSQSPAAYYRLNETVQPPATLPNAINAGNVGAAGNGTYETVTTIRGVTPGAIVSQPGNASVLFTGDPSSGNRVRIPYQPQWNTAGPFSVEFWIKPGPASDTQCSAADVEFIAAPLQRNGWLLYQNSGGALTSPGWSFRFYYNNGSILNSATILDVATPVNTNAWYHIVGTFDGTTISLYTNGSLAGSTTILGAFRPNTNSAIPLTFGSRADGASGYFSSRASLDEAAYYPTVLSPSRVLAHYQAGTNASPVTPYQTVVLADSPVGYWRLDEPGDVVTANLGTLGSAGNGVFLPGSLSAAPGPVPPVYPGYGATNKAAAFTANGSAVRLPAFNFNTNTITISAWISATNSQQPGAGLVVNGGHSGLLIDGLFGGYGLGYYWANNGDTFSWSPSIDAGLPSLPDSDWAFAALVIQPTEANIYIATTNGGTITFSSATNYFSHSSQPFSTFTLVGSDAGSQLLSFNGAIDEVAIWSRALSSGELYTQFASAVDGVPPLILTELVGPTAPIAVGDPLVLNVNVGGTPPLVYTWYKNNAPIAATTNNATFAIEDAALSDTGTYEVTVTNAFGSASSQEIAVTVVTPIQPQIVGLQGFFNRTIYPTGTLHLAVSALGGGLSYQWYRNGSPIPSATGSTYHIASVTAANAGSYYVSLTNSVGGTNTSTFPVAISVPSVAAGSYEAAIVASGPEAWWRLDEPSGSTNLFDAVARHDGVYTNVTGGALPTMGVAGALLTNLNTAVSFGTSGAIGLVPFSTLWNNTAFTIELWVKTTGTTGVRVPVSSSDNNGWAWAANTANWNGIIRNGGGNSAVALQDNGYTGAPIVPGAWTHLVITYDAQPFPYEYTINGHNAGFGWGLTGGAAPVNTTGPLILGGLGTGVPATIASLFFNGQVDEVAIYSRVLTASEITNHIVARGIELIVPTFTSQPLSQTVTPGKSVTFSASAAGIPSPLAYQWFKGGSPISLATTNSYTIPSVTLADAGAYSLRATNLAGSTFSTTATLAVVPATAYANVTNELVLHLKFEGNAQDSSGKGNNGTPSGSPAPNFVTGKIGAQAAEFVTTTIDVTNFSSASYVALGTPSDLLFGSGTSFTVGLWVKLPPSGVPGDVPFIGTEVNAANNPGWFFGPSYRAGGWQWNLNDGVNNLGLEGADNSINDGNWHYFIVTVDRAGAVVKSYLDGILVANTSITGLGSVDVGGAVTIAQDPSHVYPEASTYTLDDLGLWRRALTPVEVANIESAGAAGNSFDTVAPVVPLLSIGTSGGNVVLTYSGGTLVESTDPKVTKDAWTPVVGASSPWPVTPSAVQRYYSVRQ